MGCANIKPEETKNFDYKAKETTVKEADEFYKTIQTTCEELEKIRISIMDEYDKAIANAGTMRLVNEIERFPEAIKVLFWAISAVNEGRIKNTNPKVFREQPYIEIDKINFNPEIEALHESIIAFFTNLPKGLEQIEQYRQELIKYQKDLPQYKILVKKNVQKVKDYEEKIKYIGNSIANTNNVQVMINKTYKFEDFVKSAINETNTIVENLPEYLKEADIIGQKACEAKDFTPVEIFDKYHSGVKLPKKEEKKKKKEDDKKSEDKKKVNNNKDSDKNSNNKKKTETNQKKEEKIKITITDEGNLKQETKNHKDESNITNKPPEIDDIDKSEEILIKKDHNASRIEDIKDNKEDIKENKEDKSDENDMMIIKEDNDAQLQDIKEISLYKKRGDNQEELNQVLFSQA